ncbi:hypothetical protein BUUB107078_07115 [Burkholderia ubonensis]|nr:hypothetical protein BUB20358_06397 [Burkholderia ubonensis]
MFLFAPVDTRLYLNEKMLREFRTCSTYTLAFDL